MDQARIEGRRDDVVAPELQLAAIGDGDLVGLTVLEELDLNEDAIDSSGNTQLSRNHFHEC